MDTIISHSPWMRITNKKDSIVEIDIEGIIGGDWWDADDEEKINTREKLRAELKAIAGIKAKKIIVNINSYGGDVAHGIGMYELLVQNSAEVITRVQGFTASIATVIAMSGKKREMSTNALFLIHKPMLTLIGMFNENDLEMFSNDVEKVGEKINDIYEKAGVEKDVINDLMEENNGQGKWIDADEAVDYGFIHDTYEPIKMAAVYHDPKLFKNLNISYLPFNKTNIMADITKLRQSFEDLRNWVNEKINPKKTDESTTEENNTVDKAESGQEQIMIAPKDIMEKLTEFDEMLKGIETNDKAVADLETVKAEKAELETTIQNLQADNKTQAEKIKELEGKLTKKNAASTKIGGIEGAEDPDAETNNPELKALRKDLMNLRNELAVPHS